MNFKKCLEVSLWCNVFPPIKMFCILTRHFIPAIHQKLEADGTEKVEGSMTQKLENVLNSKFCPSSSNYFWMLDFLTSFTIFLRIWQNVENSAFSLATSCLMVAILGAMEHLLNKWQFLPWPSEVKIKEV